jgi:hypothetical protein
MIVFVIDRYAERRFVLLRLPLLELLQQVLGLHNRYLCSLISIYHIWYSCCAQPFQLPSRFHTGAIRISLVQPKPKGGLPNIESERQLA